MVAELLPPEVALPPAPLVAASEEAAVEASESLSDLLSSEDPVSASVEVKVVAPPLPPVVVAAVSVLVVVDVADAAVVVDEVEADVVLAKLAELLFLLTTKFVPRP